MGVGRQDGAPVRNPFAKAPVMPSFGALCRRAKELWDLKFTSRLRKVPANGTHRNGAFDGAGALLWGCILVQPARKKGRLVESFDKLLRIKCREQHVEEKRRISLRQFSHRRFRPLSGSHGGG